MNKDKRIERFVKIRFYKIMIFKYKKKIFIIKRNFFTHSKIEINETILMFKTIFKNKKKECDYLFISKQLKDLIKIITLIPKIVLPGTPLILPLAYKISKKFNFDLTPSSFKYNFAKLGIEINNRNVFIANQLLQNNLEITQRNFKLYKFLKNRGIDFNKRNIEIFIDRI